MDIHSNRYHLTGYQGLVYQYAGMWVEYALAFSAPDSNMDPMLAAIPVTTTLIGEDINCMVSYMAMPAVIDPPGVLM